MVLKRLLIMVLYISIFHVSTIYSAPPGSTKQGYMIISTDEIVMNSTKLDDLISHKKEKTGLWTGIYTAEGAWGGGTGDVAADRMREWLQNNYIYHNIKYLLIIGDPHPENSKVPMKKTCGGQNYDPNINNEIPTDFYYAELSDWNWDKNGNNKFLEWDDISFDNTRFAAHAELSVGRIPYYGSITDLDDIIDKIIKYDNESDISWRNSCLIPMDPITATNSSIALGEAITNSILNSQILSYYRVYDNISKYTNAPIETFNNLSNPPESYPCNYENVKNGWISNNPALVVWLTHGGPDVADDIISLNEIPYLNNNYPVMTFQTSCLTAYPERSDNLSYQLLKNGAIATIGATRPVYALENEVQDYDDRINASSEAMAYDYIKYIVNEGMEAGEALNRVRAATKKTGQGVSSGYGLVNLTGYNLYGCPDTKLGFARPTKAPSNLNHISREYLGGPLSFFWIDNSEDEPGFDIEMKPEGGQYSKVKSVNFNRTSCEYDGITTEGDYFFRIAIPYTNEPTLYSNEIKVHITIATPPAQPSAPTNLTTNIVSHDKVDLSWTDNAIDETGYTIVCVNKNFFTIQESNVGADVTSFQQTGLMQNCKYSFYVTADNELCDGGGCLPYSDKSNSVIVTTDIANDVTIGTSSYTDKHVPMEPYYDYTYSQQIYHSSDIGVNQKILIDELYFYYNGNSANKKFINVYMANTTKSSFSNSSDWVDKGDLDCVYGGELVLNDRSGWHSIKLLHPFLYDNTKNLVIAFDDNTGEYTSRDDEFYCSYTGAYRSIYRYRDNTDIDPQNPPDGYRSGYCANLKMNYRFLEGDTSGGEVIIGTGSSTNKHLPMEPYYDYSFTQQIYCKSEIDAGGPVDIKEIYFKYNGNTADVKDIAVYMATTSKSTFSSGTDWYSVDNMTHVYSGSWSLESTEGWYKITLETPFHYDNTGNLIIAFDDNTGNWTSRYDEFYCTSSGSCRSIYTYQDNNNINRYNPPAGSLSSYRANIKIVW